LSDSFDKSRTAGTAVLLEKRCNFQTCRTGGTPVAEALLDNKSLKFFNFNKLSLEAAGF
jgi:hypothetical protein